MDGCTHHTLEVLPKKKKKLRCSHCLLIISREELANGCCPECYEVRGVRHYEFEEVEEEGGDKIRYRCEECGAIIEWDGLGTEKG